MTEISPQLPLFAFGTLRRGERNHQYLNGRYDRCLKAQLFGFMRRFPLMIVRRSGSCVEGELFFLRGLNYQETMRGCERLEGIPEGATVGRDYRRIAVDVETSIGTVRAWAYVHPDTGEVK